LIQIAAIDTLIGTLKLICTMNICPVYKVIEVSSYQFSVDSTEIHPMRRNRLNLQSNNLKSISKERTARAMVFSLYLLF
jgi:hypothetical protein